MMFGTDQIPEDTTLARKAANENPVEGLHLDFA
jgi:hypothetical protein